MISRYKQEITHPFSLHDMVVRKIGYSNGNVQLLFEDGFVMIQEPYSQVDGSILIEGVDDDFCCVMLLSEFGEYGEFKGEKLSINDFLSKYEDYQFEIVDELYGYNQVEYAGYLALNGNDALVEMEFSLYFTGDIVYEVSNEGCERKGTGEI